MKTSQYLSITILLLSILTLEGHAQSKSKILGKWYNTDKTAKIEILESDSAIIGKIIWIAGSGESENSNKDAVNTDTSLRNRPLMGLTILEGLQYKKGVWYGGKVYDPESGLTYPCEVSLKKRDILEIKGYLGDTWVSKTVEWYRVK